jgi:adenylate cyclase class 2
MALEIEIKIRVTEHQSARGLLASLGAQRQGRRLETNTFLDTADGRLVSSGEGLRVREYRELESGKVSVEITHKGPKQAGDLKIREETEVEVSSYRDAVKLFGELGYEVKLSFEKRREIWDLGECEVVLDELPEQLGTFVEIEGPSESAVRLVREQLKLGDAPVESSGYAVLVAKHLRRTGRTVLTFQG